MRLPWRRRLLNRMDNLTPEARKRAMARVRGRDTGPERIVQDALARLRFKFETNCRDIPGCPDIVLRHRRKLIFVHGCFWHSHRCASGRKVPKTNVRYWKAKRGRNRARDVRVGRSLRRQGWSVMTLWECQIRSLVTLRRRLLRFLRSYS
jgi:DNA mismatch endonuclease (patch repair protein)